MIPLQLLLREILYWTCLLWGTGGKTTDAAAIPWQVTDVVCAVFSPSSALTLLLSNVWGTDPSHCHPCTNSDLKCLACEIFVLIVLLSHVSKSYLLIPEVKVEKWGPWPKEGCLCHYHLGYVTSLYFYFPSQPLCVSTAVGFGFFPHSI